MRASGYRPITEELHRRGVKVNYKRVLRLLPNTICSVCSVCGDAAFCAPLKSLRDIRVAESTYRTKNSMNQFGTLEQLHAGDPIDAELASGTKDEYRYKLELRERSFHVTAEPLKYNLTGTWSYYLDESGVIRVFVTRGKHPDVCDPPIRYH
jgi:hypothetical protein